MRRDEPPYRDWFSEWVVVGHHADWLCAGMLLLAALGIGVAVFF